MITPTNVFKADNRSGITCESFCSLKQNVLSVAHGDEDRQLVSEGYLTGHLILHLSYSNSAFTSCGSFNVLLGST